VAGRLTQFYVLAVTIISIGALCYIYIYPPQSMRSNRDGVPYFTPKVLNLETGKPVSVDELVRRYRGD